MTTITIGDAIYCISQNQENELQIALKIAEMSNTDTHEGRENILNFNNLLDKIKQSKKRRATIYSSYMYL